MRIYLAGIALFGLLSAGCTSDRDQSRAERTTEAGSESTLKQQQYPTAALHARTEATNFASLPDRGELLRYPADREVRRSGAYTLHPVEISEDHALNAIASGELKLNTPDGKTIGIKYDRIEEHPDGNWSWIGQNESGEHALVTFGERAAFGEVFANGRTLRVVMRNGSAWLMETNRAMLAGSHHGRRDDGPDYLIPPESLPVGADVSMAGSKATSTSPSSIPLKAAAVVDVAVGFTNGLVAAQGGSQAGAATRIAYLTALTNAAYQRSGVNMRIRVVNATLVNFADNTDNEDALQKLTGYNRATQQFVTPDAAFNDLREAREEFGADLVVLLRPHRAPEQNGCGIAWLIGANGSNIVPATHERFGFSVVSDGGDIDERDGNDYFCSEYSLAHELGHNMGQVHNQGDAPVAGRHAYSYGYRETSTSGFHTLMAYPLNNSSQEEISYFATPLINYAAGRPMGVAASADNVRSMNETMPLIAQFRATVVPLTGIRNDFDGDGRSDILWRNMSNGRNLYWSGGDNNDQEALATIASMNWVVVGTGDFDGNGKTDILWRNNSNNRVQIWPEGDQSKAINRADVAFATWQVVGIGDFNNDGRDDILWRNMSNGRNLYWSGGNSSSAVELAQVSDMTWRVVGVGDFDGDGFDDILWRNTSSGRNLYYGRGLKARQVNLATVADQGWVVVGVGDFNGDGKDDVLWRHSVTGRNLYYGSGNKAEQVNLAAVTDVNWVVVDVADYNGDGRSDILWRHRVSGRVLYYGGGNKSEQVNLATVANTWQIVP
ncbi:MAG: FG-GAP-like repeat-containing protein [Luteimonas sp.]|nr:FG-GAP-like repeat-containing protein [Luteimonas sp.]